MENDARWGTKTAVTARNEEVDRVRDVVAQLEERERALMRENGLIRPKGHPLLSHRVMLRAREAVKSVQAATDRFVAAPPMVVVEKLAADAMRACLTGGEVPALVVCLRLKTSNIRTINVAHKQSVALLSRTQCSLASAPTADYCAVRMTPYAHAVPPRNEPCPCGSGSKYKRCCLERRETVARELRERSALLADLVSWLQEEHEQTLEDASRETTLISLLRGPAGRHMSLVWALNDHRPVDGGPPLMARYADRADLDPSSAAIARGLAEARLDVYRVVAKPAHLWIEIEPLSGGSPLRLLSQDGLERLQIDEVLVARVVRATSMPTLWGSVVCFAAGNERRWKARCETLPADPAAAALVLLGFHPDDAAEPLPEGVQLHASVWTIDDDDAVIDALEEADLWECIGEALPTGWAFSWPGDDSRVVDLGGLPEDDGVIEVARLIIREREMTLVSADRQTLAEVAVALEMTLSGLISRQSETLAA